MNVPLRKVDLDNALPVSGHFASSSQQRRLRLYAGLMLADVAALLGGFVIAGYIYTGLVAESRAMMQAQLLLPLFLTIALYNRAYSISALTNRRDGIVLVVAALLISSVLLNFIAFYAKYNAQFSRATFTIGIALAGALMATIRYFLVSALSRSGGVLENLVIIRDGGPHVSLPHAQMINAVACGLSPSTHDPIMVNRLGNYLRHMDRVIVSCERERRGQWPFVLKCMGVSGEVLSDTVRDMGALGVRHYAEEDVATLVVAAGPLGTRSRIAKRLFDLAIAVGALILLAPTMLLIAVLIKLDDGGPVLFRQRRLGRGNRLFTIYKYRTMTQAGADPDGVRSTSRGDERVTRMGRLLRSASLDELPQLFNVLRGEMSIVGPRPHALASQAGDKLFWEVDPRYWQRHSLKPGLTGLAQVRGLRGETRREQDLSRRLQSDLEYLHQWSVWRDVALVFRTLRVIVHERAY